MPSNYSSNLLLLRTSYPFKASDTDTILLFVAFLKAICAALVGGGNAKKKVTFCTDAFKLIVISKTSSASQNSQNMFILKRGSAAKRLQMVL